MEIKIEAYEGVNEDLLPGMSIEEGRKIRGEGKPYTQYIREIIEGGAF